jgi:PAS domain S-box-containing protein
MNSSPENASNSGKNKSITEELTLLFNIDNIVSEISNINNWDSLNKEKFIGKSFGDIFGEEASKKLNKSIEKLKKGYIDNLKIFQNGYAYSILLAPHLINNNYNGFLAIVSKTILSKMIEPHYYEFFEAFENCKKCVVIYQAVNNGKDFIIRSLNTKAAKLEKVNKNDIVNRNVVEVFPGIKDFGLLDVFQRVYKTGKAEKLESKLYKDNRIQGYRENLVYKLDHDKLLVQYDDITDIKITENGIREDNLGIEIIDNIEFEGIIYAKNSIIFKINQKATDIFGYKNSANVIGKKISEFLSSKYKNLIDNYIAKNITDKFNITATHKNGNTINIQGYSKHITTDALGEINIFFIRDTTEEEIKNRKINLFTTAMEQSANAVAITDADGTIEYVNPAFTKITGYSLSEAIGQNPRILKSGYQGEEFYADLWQKISSGNAWNGIFNNKTKDGRTFWERATISPIFDDNKNIINYIALKENITKEYLQDLALKESEKKYRNLIAQSATPMVVLNANGSVDFVNDSVFKLIGKYEESSIVKDNNYNVFTDKQLIENGIVYTIKDIFNNKKAEFPVVKYNFNNLKSLRANSSIEKSIYLKTKAFPVKNEKGKITQAVLMIEDMNIAKLNELTENIIYNIIKAATRTDSISELIKIIKDEIGHLIDTSNFFVGLYNKETDSFHCPYYADTKDKFENFAAANTLSKYVIDTKKPLFADKKTKQKLKAEGKIKTIGTEASTWLGVPLIVNNEAIGVYVVQSYDSTEFTKTDIRLLEIIAEQISTAIHKKQIEENIKEQNRILEEINKQLLIEKEKAEASEKLTNAFLANMSHEIRTPMNGIIGFTQLLQAPEINDDERIDYAKVIEQSGTRLLNIINELIDISKIQANKMTVKKSTYRLNHQLEEIYRLFKIEAESKLLELNYEVNYSGQYLDIFTDSDKLQAILTNLIKNAIKYTKKGKIDFGYNITKDGLEFFVEDTGIGIPKDRQDAIFDRFVQADLEDRAVYEGAGLGLSIALAYANMLGGNITLESEVGKGSKFIVSLPMDIPDEIYFKAIDRKINKPNNNNSLINTLIIDDERFSYLYLSVALGDVCEPMHYAQNAEEALEIFELNTDIKLILMDIKLPGMNGYELTKIIKEKNPEIIIIAQTAFALEEDREKALQAGCDEYISKPVNHKKLIKIINKFFN